MVPSYQPGASLAIFERALFNKDIATGAVDLKAAGWNYSSAGPDSTWRMMNDVLPAPEPVCYVLEPSSCTAEALEAVKEGKAIIENWIVVGIEEEMIRPGEVGGSRDGVQVPLGFENLDL